MELQLGDNDKDEQIKDLNQKIQTLTITNKELQLKLDDDNNDNKDKKIKELEAKIEELETHNDFNEKKLDLEKKERFFDEHYANILIKHAENTQRTVENS